MKELVVAKPGSGKTTHIVNAVRTAIAEGVAPHRICAVTFTKDAAYEMRTRIEDKEVRVSTIHSLAFSIIHLDADPMTEPPPMTSYDKLLEDATSLIRGGMEFPCDMLAVDEAQDLNRLQYELVSLLAGKAGRVVVVGDPCQSIFSFQRSDPSLMMRLGEGYTRTKLNISYRLPSEITEHIEQIFSEAYHVSPARKGGSVQIIETTAESVNQMIKGCVADRAGTVGILFRTNREIVNFVKSVMRKTDYNYVFPVSEHPLVAMAATLLTRNTDMEPELFTTVAEFLGYDTWEVRRNLKVLKHMYLSGVKLTVESLERLYGAGDEFMRPDVPLMTPRVKVAMRSLVDTIKCIGEGLTDDISFKNIERAIKAVMDMGYVFAEGMDVTDEAIIEAVHKKICSHGEHYFTIDNNAPTTVMTVHGAKGREFDTVIHAMNPYLDSDLPEEFRILYVALTRAKENLVVLLPERKGSKRKSGTTMFDSVEQSVGII